MPMFNRGALQLLDGTADWAANTIRVRPVLTSESIDIDADVMTGIGVTGNDQTLGSKTGPTLDDTNDRVVYDAADITFPSQGAGAEINRVVVFRFVTNDADSIPLALASITPVTPNGGNIGIVWAATGVFYTQQ